MQGVGPLIAASPTRHDPMGLVSPIDIQQFQQNQALWATPLRSDPGMESQTPFQQLVSDVNLWTEAVPCLLLYKHTGDLFIKPQLLCYVTKINWAENARGSLSLSAISLTRRPNLGVATSRLTAEIYC